MELPISNKIFQFQVIYWPLLLVIFNLDILVQCKINNLFYIGNNSLPIFYSSRVWGEPEVVEQAAEEFSETHTMLEKAQEICGPYVWKIYDLLIMPPSFPFGGMENPCLTFVTPTLLVRLNRTFCFPYGIENIFLCILGR